MRKFRMVGRWVTIALSIVTVAIAFASGEKAGELVKSINDYRVSLVNEGKAGGATPNYVDIAAKVKVKAGELLKDVDPKTLDLTDGYEWASLFSTAGRLPEARDIALRYADQSIDPSKKFNAQTLAISVSYQLKEYDKVADLLPKLNPEDKQTAFANISITNAYSRYIVEKIGFDRASALIDRAVGLVKDSYLKEEADKKLFQSLKDSATVTKINFLKDAGKTQEAIAAIDKALAASDSPTLKKTLTPLKTQWSLVGTVAPALEVERSSGGTFTGLEQYKGKVVLVDFFAHWCPPCKASYPDMRKMYDDLHGKGLEIVGVTTYYGYYGDRNVKLEPDAEFAKMTDFIKEFNIAWPVAFDKNRKDFDAYGITGIPTVAVIDRNGKVHSLDVGYSPESFKKFRAEVEKLLAE